MPITPADLAMVIATLRDVNAAQAARIAALEAALGWVRDECATVDRSDHQACAVAVIKCEDFARYGLARD